MVRVTFHGAAGTVTGSCYRIEHPGGQVLVDCGLFQGTKTLRELNYGKFPFDPATIDAALLTHAHIDHSGLLPKLCKHGFSGQIFATEATRDLLSFMLPDSGHIQEFEVKRLNQRNLRRGRSEVTPIYTRRDAQRTPKQIQSREIDRWFDVSGGVKARFWNAGHILGAVSIELEILDDEEDGRPVRILFSGDLGPQEKSFHREPDAPSDVDYLVVESTYGDRDREDVTPEHRRDILRKEVRDALSSDGNLIIPVFAVERTQELLYDIGMLLDSREIPQVPVYLDSPLAIHATEVFEKHANALHDITRRGEIFRHRSFRFLQRADESRRLKRVTSGAIIMAASGMCEAGRIRHHLKNNLWRKNATVLFVGYQAPGTLGEVILNGAKSVRIEGEEIAVNARIRSIGTYSAHADQNELVEWVSERLPVQQGIFLTHGEPSALRGLRDHVVEQGYPADRVYIPELEQRFELSLKKPPVSELAKRRVPADEIATDWHNDYAAFILTLSQSLQRVPDDAKRRELLRELRDLVSEVGAEDRDH